MEELKNNNKEMLDMLILIKDKYLSVHSPDSLFDELELLIEKQLTFSNEN